jgi:hypothetical protein
MVRAEQQAFLAMKLEAEIRSHPARANVIIALPQQAAVFLRPINQCNRKTVYGLTSQHPAGSSHS